MSVPRKLTDHQLEEVAECPAHWCRRTGERLAYVEARLAEAERLLGRAVAEDGLRGSTESAIRAFLAEVAHE